MTTAVHLDEPHLPDPFAVPSLRWGVIGPGRIADTFVDAVSRFTGQRFAAVASTDAERARFFAERHGIPVAYGSYEELFADDSVDVVYVATRQEAHIEPVLAAISAAKHVLVEKPIAMYPTDVRRIQAAAMAAGVLVMEAMWTSYLPQSYVIRNLIASGQLGEIRSVRADLGQDLRGVDRLFDPRGGGAALDMGIYPVAFASMFFADPPVDVSAVGSLTDLGLDAESSIRMRYPNGGIATAESSMVAFTPTTAWVDADCFSLGLDRPFFVPTTLTVYRREFAPHAIATWSDTAEPHGHLGLCYQATAMADYVSRGLTDSPVRPLRASLVDISILTEARRALGVRYPDER